MKTFSFERARTAQAFRISPQDTNYFAILSDASKDGNDNIAVIEIFNVGGATPPNSHVRAHEFFYVCTAAALPSATAKSSPSARATPSCSSPAACTSSATPAPASSTP